MCDGACEVEECEEVMVTGETFSGEVATGETSETFSGEVATGETSETGDAGEVETGAVETGVIETELICNFVIDGACIDLCVEA